MFILKTFYGYPEKCFKKFLDIIHLVKEKVPTVERKRLLLVLTYLGVISLQSRTKLQQVFTVYYNKRHRDYSGSNEYTKWNNEYA